MGEKFLKMDGRKSLAIIGSHSSESLRALKIQSSRQFNKQ